MNDITKLPKWAQERISDLERRLVSAKQATEKLITDSRSNGTGVVQMIVGGVDIKNLTLYDRAVISFRVSPIKKIEVSLRQDDHDSYVDVSGSSIIQIEPRAANSIWIR